MSTPIEQAADGGTDSAETAQYTENEAANQIDQAEPEATDLSLEAKPAAVQASDTTEESPDAAPIPQQQAPGTGAPRVRRFGPKRSKSALLTENAPAPAEPTAPAATALPDARLGGGDSVTESPPATGSTENGLQGALDMMEPAAATPGPTTPESAEPPASRARPSRSRSRSRRPATQQAAAAAAAPDTATLQATPADEPALQSQPGILEAAAGSASVEAGVTPPATAGRPARIRTRSRTSRRPAGAVENGPVTPATQENAADNTQVAGAAEVATLTAAVPEETVPVSEAMAPPAEIVAPETQPTRTSRSRRSRRRTPTGIETAQMENIAASPVDRAEPALSPTPANGAVQDTDQLETAGIEFWPSDEPTRFSAPGGDLDGTEALAQALLEMFPPLPATDADLETDVVEAEPPSAETRAAESPRGDQDDQMSAAELEEELDAIAADASEAARRRGRRGRRGGRGRRRGAAHLAIVGEDLPPDVPATVAEAPEPTAPPVAPVLEPAPDLFTPDPAGRRDRSWRERGPQRRWGRTFPRETHAVSMPPPKPSHGGRFAPIPQAVAPMPIAAPIPEIATQAGTTFVLPDLRTDEPLAPGESRVERLLDVQTRLMRAMLEGHSRQIESLNAGMAALNQAMRDISMQGSLRSFRPRTAIFVDAPNVCYAAENARVNLDFGRMLKYLSRDRHLVHALSYSPIIDDIREGIRYETQRFVAPFLRTGYKLITKPLKRFSDGSAKGNFDLELALDILTMADRLDVVVLVSGDSDFECIIEHIQSKGVRVEVVAFASNVSTELVNIADTFIDIMQHLEHFKSV